MILKRRQLNLFYDILKQINLFFAENINAPSLKSNRNYSQAL
jgi:hypothetical protein